MAGNIDAVKTIHVAVKTIPLYHIQALFAHSKRTQLQRYTRTSNCIDSSKPIRKLPAAVLSKLVQLIYIFCTVHFPSC